MVTHRPGEQRTDEVSIQAGYPYKESAVVDVAVGDMKVQLFTQGDSAWAMDKATDKKLVQAMIKGSTMVVEGVSSRGTNTKDTYRSEEHTSELQSLMRISYAVFCLKKKIKNKNIAYRIEYTIHIETINV